MIFLRQHLARASFSAYRRQFRGGWTAGVAALLVAGSASAQDVAETPTPAPTPAPSPAATKVEDPVEVSGRIFMLSESVWGRDAFGSPIEGRTKLQIGSARFSLQYKKDDLKAVIEADLSSTPNPGEGSGLLRDAWMQLALLKHLSVRAGQMKMPVSGVELESPWDLPTIGRGTLSTLLVDRLQIGGRRPGLEIRLSGPGFLSPKLHAGAFQGSAFDGSTAGSTAVDVFGESAGARASIETRSLEVGVSGESRSVQPVAALERERFSSIGVDAIVRSGGLRVWSEAIGGSSPLDDDVTDDRETLFLMGRLIAAWRIGGKGLGEPFVEPYGSVGALDPSPDVEDDVVSEGSVGINAGRWERWRVQIEYGSRDVRPNAPVGYGTNGTRLLPRQTIQVQLGAVL